MQCNLDGREFFAKLEGQIATPGIAEIEKAYGVREAAVPVNTPEIGKNLSR